ncbi:MAG TPA: hypothetical protein VKB57_24315, partial [Acidimicrobiales bacterium]|nr:hypothetical protein [Acidimicrobiales bacterium]
MSPVVGVTVTWGPVGGVAAGATVAGGPVGAGVVGGVVVAVTVACGPVGVGVAVAAGPVVGVAVAGGPVGGGAVWAPAGAAPIPSTLAATASPASRRPRRVPHMSTP